jgi:hypothetical protein
MKARIRKKYLREAERLVADACRIYATRPRGDDGEAWIEKISRSLLSLSLVLTFDQWAQHGASRLRQMSVVDVSIESVDEPPARVVIAGSIVWSRRHAGQETEVTERFRIDCPVPSLRKTPKSVRPTIVLGITGGSAA